MKTNLLISAVLILVPGTLRNVPQGGSLYGGGSSSNQKVETISESNFSSAREDSDEIIHYYELKIDHLFTYNNPVVNYKISVNGTIPFYWDENFCVYVKFPNMGYEIMQMVTSYSGEGKLKISGRGNMNAGSFKVNKINYDSEMNVDIQGKTRYIETEKGPIPLLNLALIENWNGDLNWDIETSDPENDDLRYNMIQKVVPTKIPDSPHTGRTIECVESYLYEDQTYEQVSSVPGMGTFRWRYTISHQIIDLEKDIIVPVENSERTGDEKHKFIKVKDGRKLTANPKNDQAKLDDDKPKPKDYVTTYEPRLGPPLESIVWDVVDINEPLKRKLE